MIRRRVIELSRAVTCAIELLRAARNLEEVGRPLLDLLAQAACSERATCWAVDADAFRLRAIATWSAAGSGTQARPGTSRYRTASLSQGNAGHVWRSGKPVWSTSLVLDTALPPSLETGLRGGVWFAIKTDTSVYGVIELLGRALESKTPDNLMIVERLGFRLGHAVEELRHGRSAGRSPWQSPTGSA
jgi:GAF domain-containing protein